MKAGWAAERETLVAEVIKLEKDNELLREIIGGKMPSSMDHLWNSARRRATCKVCERGACSSTGCRCSRTCSCTHS